MDPAKYYLPKDYSENKLNVTIDQDENKYWDEERVRRSSLHQHAVYKWANKVISDHDIRNICDVGCGYAAKLNWLHKQKPSLGYWGIDQPNAVKLCQEKYDFGNWLGVDFEKNPEVPETQADLIISSDVIEHLENPDFLLDYFKKLSTEKTSILISTPERDILRGKDCLHSPNKFHVREWNKAELSAYLESRGFEIIDHKLLEAIKPNLQKFYLRKLLSRAACLNSMKYNQAVLMKVV